MVNLHEELFHLFLINIDLSPILTMYILIRRNK